jgi:hypothetical protein
MWCERRRLCALTHTRVRAPVSPVSAASAASVAQFELVGCLLGLALYNSVILAASFPIALYR